MISISIHTLRRCSAIYIANVYIYIYVYAKQGALITSVRKSFNIIRSIIADDASSSICCWWVLDASARYVDRCRCWCGVEMGHKHIWPKWCVWLSVFDRIKHLNTCYLTKESFESVFDWRCLCFLTIYVLLCIIISRRIHFHSF